MTSRTLSELAEICGATVEGDGSRVVVGPATLREARADQVSFLANPRYRSLLDETSAAGVLVGPAVERSREHTTFLRCENPDRAFSEVVELFAVPRRRPQPGVHASAVVEDGAELAEGVSVGPLCWVGAGARLGAGVVLHASVVVGADVRVGAGTELHAGVVLMDGVSLGSDCVVHPGAVIGADGFGFEPTAEGWVKIPQRGTVEIGDGVDVGANVTIDRGRFGATRIGRGVKIDDQVHVGHNVVVGDHALLIAQVGIAGSSRVGDWAILAGQVGLTGHIEVGAGARIGGGTKVFDDVPPGAELMCLPGRPKSEALRASRLLRRLPGLIDRVRDIETRLAELEGGSPQEGA